MRASAPAPVAVAPVPSRQGPKPKVLKARTLVPRGTPVGTSTDPLANTGIVGVGQQRARPAKPPTYIQSTSGSKNLEIDIGGNNQSFLYDVNLGLTRMAADGSQNNCWFDAFLFSTSSFYRTQSLSERQKLAKSLRNWCRENAGTIVNNFPVEFRDLPGFDDFNTGGKLQSELQGMKEIESLAGFIIAWYFRLNLVIIIDPSSGATSNPRMYELNCFTNVQNEDCKCIFMLYTGNHFEPLVQFESSQPSSLVGKFSWSDIMLCKIRDLSANCDINDDFQDTIQDATIRSWFGRWTQPICKEEGIEFGGRRKTMSTRKSLKRRRKTIRKASKRRH